LILVRILAELENISSADELTQKINVLDSITWVQTAIGQIESTCVENCFKKAGFSLTADDCEGTDVAHSSELSIEDLMEQLPADLQDKDYIHVDDGVCTERDYVEDITHFMPSSGAGNEASDAEEEEESDNISIPVPSVSVGEARESMQKLQHFATATGNIDIILQLKHLQITLDNHALSMKKNAVQSKITTYFQ